MTASPGGRKAATPLSVVVTNPDIRRIWLAQVVSETGDWLTRIAVTAHIANDQERPALAIAAIQAAMLLPYFITSPIAGAVADRLPRRTVMMLADLAAAFVVFGYLWVFNSAPGPWNLAVTGIIVFIHLGLAGFFEAARSALVASVAKPEELSAANALTQTTWSVCLALGSALGGWVVVQFGRNTAVFADAATFIAGAAIVFTIRGGRVAAAGRATGGNGSFREGLQYLFSRPTTAAMLVPKLVLGLVGINDLIFALAGPRMFGVPAEQSLSAYFQAVGIGTLAGPLAGHLLARGVPSRMRIGIAVAFFCEAAIFSLTMVSGSLALTAWFAGAATACGSVVWTFSSTLLQRACPDRLTGRAMALDLGLLTMTCAASLIAGGVLVDYVQVSVATLLAVTTGTYAFGGVVWSLILIIFRGRKFDGDEGRPEH